MAVPVHIKSLTKVFENARAVDDVSIHIEPGELFFLLGPSGCGKTTLLRCIAGFYQPDSGTILIGDQDVTSLPPHQRDTGMVFQSYALWPHLSVKENIAFGLQMRKKSADEIEQRVNEALDMVKMSDRANYKPNQLSGGQQQRVALARALVIHPKCLLLDEPLSNLDAKLRLEMRTEIRRICKEAGLTAIYVTHDQKEALSIADRLAVLNGGKVQQVGSPQDVYLNPASRFVANFIGETNFIEGTVKGSSGDCTEVQTEYGVFSVQTGSADCPANTAVTLSVRPEAIHLGHVPQNAPNVFSAQLENTIYLGELAQHIASLPSTSGRAPLSLQVFELNPEFTTSSSEPQPVTIWIKTKDVVLLRS